MSHVTIYHNPRCSKSRKSLELVNENATEVSVVEYLKTPPTQIELSLILKKLNCKARELLRTNEVVYKELALNNQNLSEDDLIKAMVENPILMQRPIIINGSRAVIGRPPDNVLAIL